MMMAEKNSRKIKRYKKTQQTLKRLTCLVISTSLSAEDNRLSANLLPLSIFCLDFQKHFFASSCRGTDLQNKCSDTKGETEGWN